MKKSVLDIKLMNRPIPGMSYGEDCANSGRLDNGTESFIVVDTRALSEATKDPTSLVTVQRAISMKFMFENPFSSDHVGLGGARNEIPSLIVHESSIFIFHGATPVRISKGVAAGPGNWRQSLSMQNSWLNVSRLPTSHHAMAVVNRCNGYSTNRRSIFDKPWG
jgi:hypothetical protein